MSETYRVSAAIVTYNRLSLLQEALDAVEQQFGAHLAHIIIINNHSTDGTTEWLQSLTDPRFIIKNLADNLGGAGGFHLAVKTFGEETTDDAIWLMDDDTIPQPNALHHLVKFMVSHPKTGFVTSNVRWQTPNGKPSWMNVVSPRSFFWVENMINGQNAVEVVNATFVSVLIPRNIVAQIGLPQQEYFIWGDDIEYTNRAADVYRGYFLPESVVVHKSSVNARPGDIRQETDRARLWRYGYEFRNHLLTMRRANGRKAMLKLALKTLVQQTWTLLQPGNVYRWRKLGLVWTGTWRGLWFNPPKTYLTNQTPTYVRSITKIEQYRASLMAQGHQEVARWDNEKVEALLIEELGSAAMSRQG